MIFWDYSREVAQEKLKGLESMQESTKFHKFYNPFSALGSIYLLGVGGLACMATLFHYAPEEQSGNFWTAVISSIVEVFGFESTRRVTRRIYDKKSNSLKEKIEKYDLEMQKISSSDAEVIPVGPAHASYKKCMFRLDKKEPTTKELMGLNQDLLKAYREAGAKI